MTVDGYRERRMNDEKEKDGFRCADGACALRMCRRQEWERKYGNQDAG